MCAFRFFILFIKSLTHNIFWCFLPHNSIFLIYYRISNVSAFIPTKAKQVATDGTQIGWMECARKYRFQRKGKFSTESLRADTVSKNNSTHLKINDRKFCTTGGYIAINPSVVECVWTIWVHIWIHLIQMCSFVG